jgi:hypothetical protein
MPPKTDGSDFKNASGHSKNKQQKTELFNWYDKIPERYLKKTHNPHFDSHHIKLPMRSVILGNSGSGKTQTLMNLIYNMPDTFEKIYIITKDKKEPIYEFVEDKYKKKGVEVLEGVENLPDLSKFDEDTNTLVVLDDMVNEGEKKLAPVADFYIRCRKKGCSIIFISHSWFKMPKLIRLQLSHLFIKQLSSMRDLKMIMNDFSYDFDKKFIKEMYEDATKDQKHFLLIDINAKPDERFRKNFDELYEIPENFK